MTLALGIGANAAIFTLVRAVLLRQGMYPVGMGILVGLFGAWMCSRLMQRFLFEVSPLDTAAYVAAVTALAAVATLACYVPARRATQIDPIVALKSE